MMNGDDSCGPVNPMAQMLKQFGQDRSLQRVKEKKNIVKSLSSVIYLYIYIYIE